MSVNPLRAIDPAELALRVSIDTNHAAYAAYVAQPNDIKSVVTELVTELEEGGLGSQVSASSSGAQLLHDYSASSAGTLLIDAAAYGAEDWGLLDRRRSALRREAPTIFVTTQESFDKLMRVAPNLASWFGGEVFVYPDSTTRSADQKHARNARLKALREWAQLSDEEVIQRAEARELPRDPEYAEWLVLLGRGDLLDG